MLRIICNKCEATIETFAALKYGIAQYLEKVYGDKDTNLCNKCWVQKFKDDDLQLAIKKAKRDEVQDNAAGKGNRRKK